MKRTFSFPLAATGLLLVLALTNCKKEQNAAPQNDFANGLSSQQTYSSISATNVDRIDEIVKDLAHDSYSLSFDQPLPSAGITRSGYGTDSYIVYASANSAYFNSRDYQLRVPIWKIPAKVHPSCPAFGPNIIIARKFQELTQKADPAKYGALQNIQLTNGGSLLMDKQQTAAYFDFRADKIDDMLRGLDPAKFILLNDASSPSGLFNRNFYGYADLNDKVFTLYKKNLKDILRPKYIGCYDNEIIKIIKERFQALSPVLSRNLNITPLSDVRNAAVTLSF